MLKPFSRESEIRKKEKLQEKNQRKRRKIDPYGLFGDDSSAFLFCSGGADRMSGT